jgi:hypothetical protein
VALVAALLVPLAGAMVPARAVRSTAPSSGVPALRLAWGTFDPAGPVDVPAALTARAGNTSWLVQFAGHLDPSWLDALRAGGLRPVARGYVPDDGWLVRGRPSAADAARRLPFVRAVTPYQPAFRLAKALTGRTGPVEVRAELFDDVSLAAWAPKVLGLGAGVAEVARIDQPDVKILRLRLDASLLPALARLDAVKWVEPVLTVKLFNDKAADTLGVRPVWNGALPALSVPLKGEGEIVGVADTGLDNGKNDSTMHPDFRGRIKDAQAWGRPGTGPDPLRSGDWSDAALDTEDAEGAGGHGTHTAGSVLGSGDAWSLVGATATNCTGSCRPDVAPAGMAPAAQLVEQSISGPDLGSLTACCTRLPTTRAPASTRTPTARTPVASTTSRPCWWTASWPPTRTC